MSGTMTPPSQVLDDFDASRMLISPPPEETLRSTRARSTPLSSKQPPFGSSFLANPPTSTAPPASKRKRQISPTSAHKTHDAAGIREIEDSEAVHVNTTPNPKALPQLASLTLDPSSSHSPRRSSPKKQVSVQSPHASNPNADFVALSPGRQHESGSVARRRSVTPLPPYEPPRERFTPPREVFRSLPPRSPAPRSSKRKPKHKLTLLIKKEPPDIDLSQPPPPASPTDDPLLLSGPPRHIKPHRNTATQGSRETPPLASTSPIRDEDMQHAFAFDAPSGGADTTMSDDFSIVPAFNFDGAVDDGFSSSEDEHEDFDQTGEYTGKFRMLAVPTKEDPPNSHTRERMEAWGRPISPFPRIIDLVNDPPSPSERKSASQPPVQDDPIAASAVVDIAENPFIEVHSPPREAQLSGNTTLDTSFDSAPDTESEDRSHAEQEQVSSRELSTSTVLGSAEPDGGPQGESPLSEAATAVMGDVSPKHKHDVLPAPQWSPLSDKTQSEDGDEDDDDDDDEAFVDRELSREPEAEDDEQVSPDTTRTDIVGETEVALQDDYDVESSDDDLEELDSGVIQVTSDDPLAAARAAAILKMHNYDCIPRSKASSRRQSQISIESLSSRRHSQLGIDAMLRSARRRSALESGISKNSPRKERRRTFGGFVGDEVVIPGSPNISLPELLKEPAPPAEHIKVAAFSRLAAQPQSFATPTKTQLALAASSRAAPEVNDKGALPSTWCKADWKLLDSCFTDERLSLGETRGLSGNSLAPVDDVDVECVADRFMQLLDGARKFDRFVSAVSLYASY
ncbi:predicted protein [Postia placenta Mad-698-R]|uniref:Uncharacterized protein n=1 Tax=Postia placenta MAD-698-R-SB12 TaxID=670580 RepID=A0A1X6N198_9APHY|nr:hypothetical protein POSPLADRAFT_1046731 [Postia placenta MAD-698-R-SB12]EED83299.1 predicted protein [Postia placenta Mad-698-R]OSX62388.1 hypothetical protein POSPLADRAFT_1046731 [Postia placenta MAD-698-R-SB12]